MQDAQPAAHARHVDDGPRPCSSRRGSRAIPIRIGEKKFVCMVTSRSSGVSVCTSLRLPIAALLTSVSRPPKWSQASSATATAWSTSPRSAAQNVELGVCFRHSATTSSSRSARRATMPTVAPFAASCGRAWRRCPTTCRSRGSSSRRATCRASLGAAAGSDRVTAAERTMTPLSGFGVGEPPYLLNDTCSDVPTEMGTQAWRGAPNRVHSSSAVSSSRRVSAPRWTRR